MSSQHRSSSGSGVRNLRAMFEGSEGGQVNSPDRGRSPVGSLRRTSSNNLNGSHEPSPGRLTRKVTTSFVPVGGTMEEEEPTLRKTPSNSVSSRDRRESFSATSDDKEDNALLELKKTVSKEVERRKSMNTGKEVVPDQPLVSAVSTPLAEISENASMAPATRASASPESLRKKSTLQSMTLPERERQSEHTEKLVSAVEDEDAGSLRPADPKDEMAISGDEAVVDEVGAETARQERADSARAPKLNGTTGTTSTLGPMEETKANKVTKATKSKPATASAAVKKPIAESSTANTAKSTVRSAVASTARAAASKVSTSKQPKPSEQASVQKPRPKSPTRPANVPSHLTAPTASYKAKRESLEPGEATKAKESTASSTSKPVARLSHLTAPTKASAAKQETESSKAGTATNTSTVGRVKNAMTKRDRNSIASTSSLASNNSARKPTGAAARQSLAGSVPSQERSSANKPAPSGDFLSRMTRPTASSAQKSHEKIEVKSPPRPRPASKDGPSAPGKMKQVGSLGLRKKRDSTSGNKSSDVQSPVEQRQEEPLEPAQSETIETDTAADLATEGVAPTVEETGSIQTPEKQAEVDDGEAADVEEEVALAPAMDETPAKLGAEIR